MKVCWITLGKTMKTNTYYICCKYNRYVVARFNTSRIFKENQLVSFSYASNNAYLDEYKGHTPSFSEGYIFTENEIFDRLTGFPCVELEERLKGIKLAKEVIEIK